MPINLEISLITQPTFRCGFPVKLYIWGTSTEITYEYVLSHNWALLLIGWTKFSATQKHQIVRKDWVMIWHQYGISAHIPWASFRRESPVLGSHVSMSVFSGYTVVGFKQCKACLTAGSTFFAAFHCRFPPWFGFKGIWCPWLLSEVILELAKDRQYLQ